MPSNRTPWSPRTVRTSCITVLIFGIVTLHWFAQPYIRLWAVRSAENQDGERRLVAASKHLAELGPRAIPATLRTLRQSSIYASNGAYIPRAFREMGASSKKKLIDAIENEDSDKYFFNLVSALQRGFGDFSYLDELLERTKYDPWLANWGFTHIQYEVMGSFPDSPQLLDRQDNLALEFLDYWRNIEHKQSEQLGSLWDHYPD